MLKSFLDHKLCLHWYASHSAIHHHHHLRLAPLRVVRSATGHQQPPEWSILGQVDCFGPRQPVFIQVIRGRPGGLFQYTEGEEVKICFASTLSSIRAICPNRVIRHAWIISVSRGWMVWSLWCRTSSLEMK